MSKSDCRECAEYDAVVQAERKERLRAHADETGCEAYSHVRDAVGAKRKCADWLADFYDRQSAGTEVIQYDYRAWQLRKNECRVCGTEMLNSDICGVFVPRSAFLAVCHGCFAEGGVDVVMVELRNIPLGLREKVEAALERKRA